MAAMITAVVTLSWVVSYEAALIRKFSKGMSVFFPAEHLTHVVNRFISHILICRLPVDALVLGYNNKLLTQPDAGGEKQQLCLGKDYLYPF